MATKNEEGARNRGGADSYYGRPKNPHYYKGTTNGFSLGQEKVHAKDMTKGEIAAYHVGYDENEASGDKKQWESVDHTPAKAITGKLLECIQSVMESPVTGTRKVQSFDGKDGHRAEVRFNSEFDEYSVHHYKNGKHLGEGPVSYHGDDKEDAIGTAKHEAERGIKA